MPVQLALNKTVRLPTELSNNKAIFTSSTLDLTRPGTIDNTNINLLNNLGDFLLHISFRRYEDAVVLNSRTASGPWGPELRFLSLERTFGPNLFAATIVVKDVGNSYQIFINGNYLATYVKRIGGDAIEASYLIGTGQDSIFSNPINVEIQD